LALASSAQSADGATQGKVQQSSPVSEGAFTLLQTLTVVKELAADAPPADFDPDFMEIWDRDQLLFPDALPEFDEFLFPELDLPPGVNSFAGIVPDATLIASAASDAGAPGMLAAAVQEFTPTSLVAIEEALRVEVSSPESTAEAADGRAAEASPGLPVVTATPAGRLLDRSTHSAALSAALLYFLFPLAVQPARGRTSSPRLPVPTTRPEGTIE